MRSEDEKKVWYSFIYSEFTSKLSGLGVKSVDDRNASIFICNFPICQSISSDSFAILSKCIPHTLRTTSS